MRVGENKGPFDRGDNKTLRQRRYIAINIDTGVVIQEQFMVMN